MRIAYNPKTAAALSAAPSNDDITFDLKGIAIYVKGVKFKGTDTTYSVFKKHTSDDKGGHNGLVPVPSYTTTTTRYLREDGTWVVPTNTTYSVFTGATSSTDGTLGLVPKPTSGNQGKFLKADGTWATPANTTYGVVSSSANGLAPKVISTNTTTVGTAYYVLASSNGSNTPSWYKLPTNAFKNDNTTYTFASGNGGFTVTPSGGTDQFVSIGNIDWDNITNKPDTFTPSTHTHTTDNITKLTNYTKATVASDLATTDTLNAALGKLEYKAHYAYNWVTSVTAEDTDDYINKWGEIVEFLNSVEEETDILEEFVTIKTAQTITGAKTFSGGVTLSCGLNINGTNPITWNDGTYHQRILTTDDSSANTNLFEFQQSKDTGKTWESLFTIKDDGNVVASKFITTGGTSSQFVKGDGSLDSNTYLTSLPSHNHSLLKGWADTRAVATTPDDYNGAFKVVGIKLAGTTLGLTVAQSGSYATLIGWRGCSDRSGGYSWEIASTDKNRLYVRSGATTVWNNGWQAIAYLNDIPTSLKNPNKLTLLPGTFSASSYDGSAEVIVNIPTRTSHLTNDSGFLTQHQSLENYVTLNTILTITGAKTFTASTNTFSGTSASILTVDRNSTNPAWIKFCKNGTLQGYIGITNDFQPVFLSGEAGASNKTLIHAGNYTSYVNTTNFPGLNSVGDITEVKAGTGLSGGGTSGSVTLTNAGVRSATISGNYLRINTNGTNADLTIPFATNADKLDNIHSTGFYRNAHISTLTDKDLNYANNQYGTWSYGDDNTQKNTPEPLYGCYLSWGALASSDSATTRNQTAQIGVDCWNDLGRMYVRARKAGNKDVSIIGDWKTVAFISDIPTKVSLLTNDSGYLTSLPSHTHSYLPLAGGTISNTSYGPLTIERKDSVNTAAIRFKNSNGVLGSIGMNTVNGNLIIYNAATSASRTILDSGNSSVSGGGDTWGSAITVNINGTSKTLTIPSNPNTDSLVQQSKTTTSNMRPILMGYTLASTASDLETDVTSKSYVSSKIYAIPSTGTLYATTFSGNIAWENVTGKPTIPTVGNGKVTIKQGGTSKGSFTMNQSGDTTIELTDNNTNYYHTRAYSSGLKISTGTGVSDMYVPTGTTSTLGVVKQYTSADCTNYTSDEGATTPAAVKKAVTTFVSISRDLTSGTKIGTITIGDTATDLYCQTNTNTDTKVTQTVTSSNLEYPLLLAKYGQTNTTTTTAYFDSGVTLNPSTNTITANITGSAGSVAWTNVLDKPSFATVATSGSYNDLSNKPSIPTVTNYYWANVKVSSSSSTDTTPTFGSSVRINSSISGAGGDVYLEWWRGTKASWKILNSDGVLKFLSNYTTTVESYFDCLTIDYNTGNTWIKGRITASGASIGGYNNTTYALSTSSFICLSWIRTTGSTGWYNESYGGGWYMKDSTWIRNYNSKQLYLSVVTYPSLVCNAQGGSESNIRFEIAGANKGYVGYHNSYGTFLFNSTAGRYVYISDVGYFYTQSYIYVGAGNEKNASSPPYVWGVNGSDNFMRTYATSSLSAGYLKIHDIRDNNYAPNSTAWPLNNIRAWFNLTGTPDGTLWSGITLKGWDSTYNVWQLAGTSHNADYNIKGLFFRTGNGANWDSWQSVSTARIFTVADNTSVVDFVKSYKKLYAGLWFSRLDYAWASSATINVGSYGLDRMRYSAVCVRTGNLNETYLQSAMLFVPTYSDRKFLYLAQMYTSGTAGSVTTSVKRYADYDTIIQGSSEHVTLIWIGYVYRESTAVTTWTAVKQGGPATFNLSISNSARSGTNSQSGANLGGNCPGYTILGGICNTRYFGLSNASAGSANWVKSRDSGMGDYMVYADGTNIYVRQWKNIDDNNGSSSNDALGSTAANTTSNNNYGYAFTRSFALYIFGYKNNNL